MQASQLPLRDIHIPEPITWWPPAIGWWFLAVLTPLLIVFFVWFYKRLTRQTALKTAKKYLTAIKQDTSKEASQKLAELSVLIRRVAISVAPRELAAGLTGREWLAYLDQSVKGSPFSEGVGQLLADAPYRKSAVTDAEISPLISLCEDWLKAQAKK
jgi:Domain of unknown function (DUF4381)